MSYIVPELQAVGVYFKPTPTEGFTIQPFGFERSMMRIVASRMIRACSSAAWTRSGKLCSSMRTMTSFVAVSGGLTVTNLKPKLRVLSGQVGTVKQSTQTWPRRCLSASSSQCAACWRKLSVYSMMISGIWSPRARCFVWARSSRRISWTSRPNKLLHQENRE